MTNDTKKLFPAHKSPSALAVWALLAAIFSAVLLASLFTPPLLDDVDASHAQAAQQMAESGDWVTLKVNGLRYLEKPPLPYWLDAAAYRIFGQNVFATHLPNALALLGCAWICWLWAGRAYGRRAGLYAALGVLTSVGPFLFTRFAIPEALLSFLLLAALYLLLTGCESSGDLRFYGMWAALALGVLTKGLIAPIFFAAAVIPLLLLSGQWRRWRQLKPLTGLALFLAVAAPWHILAGLANPGQGHPVGNHPTPGNVHGFWYFYFVNEHLFRFTGARFPHDFNKLPTPAYWLLHLVWLFPWSLFVPALLALAWKTRRRWTQHLRAGVQALDVYLGNDAGEDAHGYVSLLKFRTRTIWLLSLFAGFILLFFSLSSNQEYYTFPAWPPLLILIAGTLAGIEEQSGPKDGKPLLSTAWLTGAQALFAVVGSLAAAALGWGLWESRHLPFVDDVGTLLAHRGVGDYTLSMSHIFDLTGPSFAALRLPSALAAAALLVGPALGWLLRLKGKHIAATVSVALTSSVFLIAAHIAFARFEPMLSSKQLADTIVEKASPADSFIIYGDQSDASSVVFYTHSFFHGKPALLIGEACSPHGEGSSMVWGSCYSDAPKVFISEDQLTNIWGTGERKWLFAQDINQSKAEQLLAGRLFPVQSIADKAMWTDRALK
jgi:4-amino-4-deoxy-L-arabinose transferase-like glycosyltransferase